MLSRRGKNPGRAMNLHPRPLVNEIASGQMMLRVFKQILSTRSIANRAMADQCWRGGNRACVRLAEFAAVLAALAIALGGCSLMGLGMPTPQQRARDLEPMLSAAGFHMIPAETPAKMNHLKSLPPLKVNYYTGSEGQTRYWFADPQFCRCLYLGDEAAYQRYENLRVQARIAENEQEAAEENYEAQQQMQMNMMSPFGFGFGPGMGFGF